jgi:serine/threonine protein kinase/Tol biopolymer transport system component
MGLATGTRLGPYEIQTPLGAGGMGEVYRARDVRLERNVAVKVLPAELSADPALRQRLEREAKAISKLSHPHVCTLYDIGHQDGLDFLVMEMVEGETLEHRLTKGPLPADQTIRTAAQIAEALAKAHKLGIIHRDLKPSNVMLTKAGAKLMDFGLAKESGLSPLAAALTEMTAEPSKLTAEGTILGTFQYMAPEQLEGKEVDARTDIFALGTLIYEMATARPAFAGKSRASLIAAILTSEPQPMARLQPMTPPALEWIVKKCIAKDPDERWQSASDLASELQWIGTGGSQMAENVHAPRTTSRWLRAVLLSAVALLIVSAAGITLWKSTTKQAAPMYFHAPIPFAVNDLAISPDGRKVVMVAYSTQVNSYVLWTYEVGSQQTRQLEGTQGASYPFWSPDGKFIAFFADAKLKKTDANGGQPQIICEAPYGRGGTWNKDGVIVFSPRSIGALSRVSAWGGTQQPLTTIDRSRFETSHRWPVFLPDGKHFLYLAANFTGKFEYNAIFVGSLDSAERTMVVTTSANASYVDPGYLVYMRDRTLVWQPFDRKRFVLSGQPRTLSDEVLFFPQVDRAVFGATTEDVLATQVGKGVYLAQVTWYDRAGRKIGTVGPPGWYNNVKLSPDGRKVAADQTDPDGRNVDVWIHDLARGSATRLTFNPSLDQSPVWSPDGTQVLFTSNMGPSFHLFRKNADGSGPDEDLANFSSETLVNAWDWSRDNKYALVKVNNELWYLSWADRKPKPLLPPGATVLNAQFSPDARWVAYASNESGHMEIYVSPFPSGSGKWQVSTGGGEEPRWRRDGKELFYLSPGGKLMAVEVNAAAAFQSGTPVALFQTHRRQPVSSQDMFSYDVSADGKQFLVATNVDEANVAPMSVFLNWTSAEK